MAATSLIFGTRADIKLYHGDYFDGYTWTFKDSAGVAYTWPDGVAELELKLYKFRGGPQIGTTINTSNGLAQASEVVTLTAAFATFDSSSETFPGDVVYYEIILTTTTGSKTLTPTYGYATII